MDSIIFLKTNHLDSEACGCQEKKKKERGPETVVNISKRAAGLQPFITRSGHFAYKHPDTSSNILEVKWVPPPPPSQVTKLYTHPATRTLGYYQTPGGGGGPKDFLHTGLSPGLSTLATLTLTLPLGDHRANTGNHMVEQGVKTQRKCSVKS